MVNNITILSTIKNGRYSSLRHHNNGKINLLKNFIKVGNRINPNEFKYINAVRLYDVTSYTIHNKDMGHAGY